MSNNNVATLNKKNHSSKLSYLMLSTALTAVGLISMTTSALAGPDLTIPVNGIPVDGGVVITSNPGAGYLQVDQSKDRVVINWDSFNIGSDATVQFYQPNTSSLAVNRVVGAGQDPTKILGTLKANGNVMVLDRNGVIFGKNAIVDVGGIVASTGNIDNAQVLSGAGQIKLNDIVGGAEVINKGTITVANYGLASLVASSVKNSGVINAKLGRVALAAGIGAATVDLYGDGLVSFAPVGTAGSALSKNSGTINALGGTVALTASAAKEVVDQTVNMKGVINASSASVSGGKIILSGKKVNVKSGAVLKADTTNIQAHKVNLDSTIEGTVTGAAKVVNILSNGAKISQGLDIISENGTVNVAAGTYDEDLVISKAGVTLNGSKSGIAGNDASRGAGETIITPHSPGVVITANGVTVDGLTITGASNGIEVNGADYVTLKNNVITDSSENGILLNGSSYADISANGIYGTYLDGIYSLKGSNNNIHANDISGTGSSAAPAERGNGVRVDFGSNNTVADNTITKTRWDGVKIVSSNGSNVTKNTLTNLNRSGVGVDVSSDVTFEENYIDNVILGLWSYHNSNISVKGNTVKNVRDSSNSNGIQTYEDNGVLISGNTIDNVYLDGVYSKNSNNVTITKNTISNSGRAGIPIERGNGVRLDGGTENVISANDISGTRWDGVKVVKSDGISITENDIHDLSRSGIAVESSKGADISNNSIKNILLGIWSYNNSDTNIDSNKITNAYGQHGIQSFDDKYTSITNNVIDGSNNDGIYGHTSYELTISNNTVDNTKQNGIEIYSSDNTDVSNNLVGTVGGYHNIKGDGVHIVSSNDTNVDGNEILNTAANGVYLYNVFGSIGVNGNTISGAAYNGVSIGSSYRYSPFITLDVKDNDISNSGYNGVILSNLQGDLEIDGNTIDNSGYDGIYANNINNRSYFFPAITLLESVDGTVAELPVPVQQLLITNNTINSSNYDGIDLDNVGNYVNIEKNKITNSGEDGVYVYNSSYYDGYYGSRFMEGYYGGYYGSVPIDLHIVGNTIENNDLHNTDSFKEGYYGGYYGTPYAGIELDISRDGYAEISGNTIGQNFQYGLVAHSGDIDLTGAGNIIHDTDIGMGFYPRTNVKFIAATPEAVDDNSGLFSYLANQLHLVNDTIGSTSFVNQNDLFVDLGFGAFFAPGSPTVLNGNDATYTIGANTISPTNVGGVSAADLALLENMFYHYNDQQDRGLFFFDVLSQGFDEKDVFTTFGSLASQNPSGSLLITGLPRIGGAAGIGGTGPANFNNITPAAGGEEDQQDGNVANVEPSAGGADNSACWADANQTLGGGGAVQMNLGGSTDQLLSDVAKCGS